MFLSKHGRDAGKYFIYFILLVYDYKWNKTSVNQNKEKI